MLSKLALSILVLIFSISLLADMRGTDSNGKPVVLRSDGTWSYLSQNNPEECKSYARQAISQQQTNIDWQCNYTDVAWHGDFQRHYIFLSKPIRVARKYRHKCVKTHYPVVPHEHPQERSIWVVL